MKKFIFGLMLLVSMLGIVGCSNPSNSDDPVPVDETEYTIINKTGVALKIAYMSASGEPKNEKTVAANAKYTVKKRDVYTYPIDNVTCAFFYTTSNLNQDLKETTAKAIGVEALAESFEIPQDNYWL